AELCVELARHEPGMSLLGQLDQLDARPGGREAGEVESARDEPLAVRVVHLVAMTMALGGLPPVVELPRARALVEHAGVGTEAHREIGRASCRERVEMSGVAVSVNETI